MLNLTPMRLVTQEDYEEYTKKHGDLVAPTEEKRHHPDIRKSYGPPMDYIPESTTVWSFPERGDWATHSGSYRGNWSPYIPRNLILKYTKEGELVLDQMCGSGTTLVECRLLNRNGIGVDINPHATMLTLANLRFENEPNRSWVKVYTGDARNLNDIGSNSVDLIATHPPYAGIIPYSKRTIDGDLSALSVPSYVQQMRVVAQESFRVLKPGKYCGILIGDTRKHRHYVPIAFSVMAVFLQAGFLLKEDIIKLQWKMKGTRERWRGKSYDFYKIAHEHLFVFRKPETGEKGTKLRLSSSRFVLSNDLEHCIRSNAKHRANESIAQPSVIPYSAV